MVGGEVMEIQILDFWNHGSQYNVQTAWSYWILQS